MSTDVARIAQRAVVLQAIGQEQLALRLIEPGFREPTLGLELAVGMARVLIDDDDRIEPQRFVPALPPACAALAMPVVVQVIELTRGDHLGGMHQVWHRLDAHVHTDVLATMLAVVGHATRHPERN